MTIQSAIEKVEKNYAHQPEFIQAVKEVALTIDKVYADNPKFEEYRVFERLCEPDRIIGFRVNWENDKGEVEVKFNEAGIYLITTTYPEAGNDNTKPPVAQS